MNSVGLSVKAKWKETTIEGDMFCPKCGGLLAVFVAGTTTYALCTACKQYFLDDTNAGLWSGMPSPPVAPTPEVLA